MMVLSLPLPEGKTVGHETIKKKLFSDVGFRCVNRLLRCLILTCRHWMTDRNFLDEISCEIVDWLRDEEAKYQSELVIQTVQDHSRHASPQSDQERTPIASAIDVAHKKPKGAAAKGNHFFDRAHLVVLTGIIAVRTPSVTSDSGHSSDEDKAIRDNYVHPTSLKAWKEKKDREVHEKEHHERQQQQQQQQPPPPAAKSKQPTSEGGKPAKVKSARGAAAAGEKSTKPSTPREKSPKESKSPKRPSSPATHEKSTVRTTSYSVIRSIDIFRSRMTNQCTSLPKRSHEYGSRMLASALDIILLYRSPSSLATVSAIIS